MIPKVIHYCWFGRKPHPLYVRQCLKSWRKFCPDYTIKEWNEDNSPLHLFPFAQAALAAQKYAFVSDVIRLYALFTEGGIYLDTDVELVKSLDPLLGYPAFTGYEQDNLSTLQTAIMGGEAGNKWFSQWLGLYENLSFSSKNLEMAKLVNNRLISNYMMQCQIVMDGRYKILDGIVIFPSDYFCPMSYTTHLIHQTENTFCIHYYSFSWSYSETIKGYVRGALVSLLGLKTFYRIKNCFVCLFR